MTLTRRLLIVLALLVAALAVSAFVPWKLNFARGWIESRALAATGRVLQIEGDVWWRWGRVSRLSADGLRFANPAWAGRPDMVKAERVDLGIALWPLLRGRLELREVSALRPDVWLERQGERHNWYLDTAQSDGSTAPTVGALSIEAGRLSFIDQAERTRIDVVLQTVAKDGRAQLSVEAQGQLRGMALKARATGDDALALRDADTPYRFALDATLGSTRVVADGEVTAPAAPTVADIKVSMQGSSLGEWYRIAGVGLPETPPYRTEGHLRYDGQRWTYEDFTSTVGRSDLGGRIVYERRRDAQATRPFISGKLVSKSLDLRDFAPAVGGTPAVAKPPPSSAKSPAKSPAKPSPRAAAVAPSAASSGPASTTVSQAPGRRVLPQVRFDSERWASLDADIEFTGAEVRNLGSFPLDDLVFRLQMQDGRLGLAPFKLRAGGGNVQGSLTIDGSTRPMRAQLDAQWRGLQLRELLPQLAQSKDAFGAINGRAKLSGEGDSFAQLLGTASGEAQLAMGKGRVSNLLVELMDLDAFEALSFFVRGDKDVVVRCAVIDGAFERGVMTPRTAVFDTEDTVVNATGRIDFAQERLALRVTPLPKDMSPLTARVPFDVTGSFASPSLTPDAGSLAVRGGGALLLGLINPLAALIPLFETGPGKDADCSGLLAIARKEGLPVGTAGGVAAPPAAQVQNKK